MITFKEILSEGYTVYSKKSSVSNSKEISQELYNLVQNSKQVEQTLGRVFKNKMKPDMFTVELWSGGFGLDVYAKPPTKKPGMKPGRKATKSYEYISIKYSDWFNGDTARINFRTAKDLNTYLDNLRGMK